MGHLKKGDAPSSQPYCICNIKRKNDGFMIACDGGCENWFHDDCVNVSRKEADAIDMYYCDQCRSRNPSLKIKYKKGREPRDPKQSSVKQETLEEKKQERKSIDGRQPASFAGRLKQLSAVQAKVSPDKRKVVAKNPRARFKPQVRKQCSNPICVLEARSDSKYCSDECGYAFNKKRYEKFFITKYRELESNHSKARLDRMKELSQLDDDKSEVESLIKTLRLEKEGLESNIKAIKAKAEAMRRDNNFAKKTDEDEASDDETNNQPEEALSADQTKMYCVTCGIEKEANKMLNHWFICHKKQETQFNYTSDIAVTFAGLCKDDPDPKVYCNHQDKKSKRYCAYITETCPHHSNCIGDKNEVCACPLNISQKLIPDGKYCLELKKHCHLHYHWDRFRLAQINLQRIHAFLRLDLINEKMRVLSTSLADTYGGVVGVMLHNTTSVAPQSNNDRLEDVDMVDVE